MSEPSLMALSVRQPWAWLIVKGYKDVENRTWWTRFRGRFLVHAAKGMTRAEYDDCKVLVATECLGLILPDRSMLPRGGIVGWATLTNCVRHSDSKWFSGPFGFVLAGAEEWDLRPCRGALGFFLPDPLFRPREALAEDQPLFQTAKPKIRIENKT